MIKLHYEILLKRGTLIHTILYLKICKAFHMVCIIQRPTGNNKAFKQWAYKGKTPDKILESKVEKVIPRGTTHKSKGLVLGYSRPIALE